MLKILCSFLLMVVILGISMNKAEAHSSASISADEGFSSYNGWVMADMTINESGIVTPDASYSMRIYTAMGLVPVAYCASGGSHMGTYYTFFVNPSCISKALGHKKSNVGYFSEKGIKITVKPDETIEKYSCRLKG